MIDLLRGYIANLIAFLKVFYGIKPLISNYYETASSRWDTDILFYTELAFNSIIKDIRQTITFEKHLSEDNYLKFADFNETVIELRFLFCYLNDKCVENDTNIEADTNIGYLRRLKISWTLELWMVYHAKKYIPKHLHTKLKERALKQNSFDTRNILVYLRALYHERKVSIFDNLNSDSHQEYIEYGLKLAFFKPLPDDIKDAKQIVDRSRLLNGAYSTLIENYPKVYEYIKYKRMKYYRY